MVKNALEIFKANRKARRLSYRALAAKIGVSYQAISDYEKGKYPPIPEVWKKLKKALALPGKPEDYWGSVGQVGRPPTYDENSVCKEPGCKEKPLAKGLCSKHYSRKRYEALEKSAQVE